MAKYSKKRGQKKNKYGMIALTFNRSTKLSHIVPNAWIILCSLYVCVGIKKWIQS